MNEEEILWNCLVDICVQSLELSVRYIKCLMLAILNDTTPGSINQSLLQNYLSTMLLFIFFRKCYKKIINLEL